MFGKGVLRLKKLYLVLLMAVLLVFTVSCGTSGRNSQKLDAHRWSRFYFNDEMHWRTCLDGGCEAIDTEMHSTENPICLEIPACDICGEKYGGPVPHTYDEAGECIRCGEKEHSEGLVYFHADGYYVVYGIEENAFADVEISPVHKGLPVVEIGSHAFAQTHTMKSIVIPDSVQKIGWAAFSGCDALESVVLPSSLKTLEGYLFNGCTSLVSVTVPHGVESICDRAFYSCASLDSVVLPDTLTVMDGTPFYHCDALRMIVFEGTITEWEQIEKSESCIPKQTVVRCLDGEIPMAEVNE